MLVVGILIGVGISGRGFVDDAERRAFNDRIAGLAGAGGRRQRDRGRPRAAAGGRAGLRRRPRIPSWSRAAWRERTSPWPCSARSSRTRSDFVESAIRRRRRPARAHAGGDASPAPRGDRSRARGTARVRRLRRRGAAPRTSAAISAASSSRAARRRSGTRSRREIVEEQSGDLADAGRRGRRDPVRRAAGGRQLALPRRLLPGARQHRRSRRRRRAVPGRAERDPRLPATTASRPSTGSTPSPASWRWCSSSATRIRGTTASATPRRAGSCRRSSRCRPQVAEPLTILIAARDEEARIGTTIAELRKQFPERAGDRRRRRLARREPRASAEDAGARVVRLPHRGKGQALTLGERVAPPGDLLLCDADLRGDLTAAARRRQRPDDRRLRAEAGRRVRDREGGGATADPARFGLCRAGAALGPAPPDVRRRATPSSRSPRASAARRR